MAMLWKRQVRARAFSVGRNMKRGRREWIVCCDDRDDDPDTAAAYVATRGEQYNTANPDLLAVDISADEAEPPAAGRILYRVSVDYSTDDEDAATQGSGGGSGSNELLATDQPLEMRIGFEGVDEQIYQALGEPTMRRANGNVFTPTNKAWQWQRAIVSSAGRPFDPSISETFRDPVITLTKNIETNEFFRIWPTIKRYITGKGSVNSAKFRILYRNNYYPFEASTCWLTDATTDPGYDRGVYFERLTLTIKYRDDGWRRKIEDRGLHAYRETAWDKTKIPPRMVDSLGEDVTESQPLNGEGKKMDSEVGPILLEFPTRPERRFQSIGLAELVN